MKYITWSLIKTITRRRPWKPFNFQSFVARKIARPTSRVSYANGRTLERGQFINAKFRPSHFDTPAYKISIRFC